MLLWLNISSLFFFLPIYSIFPFFPHISLLRVIKHFLSKFVFLLCMSIYVSVHEYWFPWRPEESIRSPGLEVVVSSLMICVLGMTLESSERREYALVNFILIYFYYSVLSPFFNSLKLFFIVLVTSFGVSKFTDPP